MNTYLGYESIILFSYIQRKLPKRRVNSYGLKHRIIGLAGAGGISPNIKNNINNSTIVVARRCSVMNTLFGFMFEQLISFAAMSLYFCSVNSHYQKEKKKMKNEQ